MVQMRSTLGDIAGNTSTIFRYMDDAREGGSDLICFPEACLTGYTNDGPAKFAVEFDGPEVAAICEHARSAGMMASFGFIESSSDQPFLTQVLVAEEGMLVYRKTHLGRTESGVFGAGCELPVLKTPVACVGMHLCWESHIPDISTTMRGRGAELMLLPHAGGLGGQRRRESWERFLPARANDNGMFVAACNAVGDNGAGLSFGGGICVLDPKGRVLAEHYGDEPLMLTCDLDGTLPRDGSDQGMGNISYFDRRRPELY